MPAKLLYKLKLLRKKVRDLDMNLVLWIWSTRTRTHAFFSVLVLVLMLSKVLVLVLVLVLRICVLAPTLPTSNYWIWIILAMYEGFFYTNSHILCQISINIRTRGVKSHWRQCASFYQIHKSFLNSLFVLEYCGNSNSVPATQSLINTIPCSNTKPFL